MAAVIVHILRCLVHLWHDLHKVGFSQVPNLAQNNGWSWVTNQDPRFWCLTLYCKCVRAQ